jgi:hypothetical protein
VSEAHGDLGWRLVMHGDDGGLTTPCREQEVGPGPMRAECLNDPPCFRSPCETCGCGLYAYADVVTALAVRESLLVGGDPCGPRLVLAEVAGWGFRLRHPGFPLDPRQHRYELVELRRLFVPVGAPLESLRAVFQVPVEVFGGCRDE